MAASEVRAPAFVVVDGSRAGDRLEVPAGRSTIGRKGDLELVLDDAGVSRVHARVERTGDAVRLTDLGSTNGTTVNDRPVTSAQPLADGDRIGIGSVELAFEGARRPATGEDDTSGRAAPRTPASGRRRVRLVRVLVVGGLVEAAVVVAVVMGIVATGGVLGTVLLVLAPVLGLAAAAVSIVRQERAGRAAERRAVPAAQPGEPPAERPDAAAGPRTVATPGGPAVPAPPTEPTTRPRASGMDSTTTEAPRIDADAPAGGVVTAAVAAVVSLAVVGLAGGLVAALVALVVQATGVV